MRRAPAAAAVVLLLSLAGTAAFASLDLEGSPTALPAGAVSQPAASASLAQLHRVAPTPTTPATKGEGPASTSPAGDPTRALRDALSRADVAERVEGIRDAVRSGGEALLPLLEATMLAHDPEAAPTIIQSVATLGASASAPARRHATETLSRWLREERARVDTAPDARGNVSMIVEALATIGGPESVDALVSALDSATLPLHVSTLAVQGLVASGDPRGRPAIDRFVVRVRALEPADELEAELRDEALEAAGVKVPGSP